MRALGIETLFDKLYTLQGKEAIHISMQSQWSNPPEGFLVIVPREERKPNPRLLLDICRREGVEVKATYYVGDSLVRDVAMARGAGITSIWARYGIAYDPRCWEYLVKITHWTNEDVVREKDLKSKYGKVIPDFTIESFDQISNILDANVRPTIAEVY